MMLSRRKPPSGRGRRGTPLCRKWRTVKREKMQGLLSRVIHPLAHVPPRRGKPLIFFFFCVRTDQRSFSRRMSAWLRCCEIFSGCARERYRDNNKETTPDCRVICQTSSCDSGSSGAGYLSKAGSSELGKKFNGITHSTPHLAVSTLFAILNALTRGIALINRRTLGSRVI